MKKENETNETKKAINYEPLLCPVDLFRYFLRKNYKEIEMTNEECDGLGEDFYKYLRALNLTEEQKKNILPKNTFDVILNADHPLRTNGFPPAYVLHFAEYVEKEKQKALAEGYSPNGA